MLELGLRLSALILPLIAGGAHEQVHTACRSLRLQVRGIHGEGTQSVGRILQISNAGCFGVDEHQIVEEFTRAIQVLVDYELAARDRWRQEEASLGDLGHQALSLMQSGQQSTIDALGAPVAGARLANSAFALAPTAWADAWLLAQPCHARIAAGNLELPPVNTDLDDVAQGPRFGGTLSGTADADFISHRQHVTNNR